MTVEIVIGDLLEAKEDVLIHSVNAQGKMGSGIAKQIRAKYPKVYDEYMKYCNSKPSHALVGDVQAVKVEDGKYICNLFGQLNYGYDGKRYTSYDALCRGLEHIKEVAKREELSVALPFGIGSVLGGANWNIVYTMIDEIFKEYKVTIYKLEDN